MPGQIFPGSWTLAVLGLFGHLCSHVKPNFHWEIKGRFCKRVVLANVPRSGFRSGGTCERTLVPAFVQGEHLNVPSFRFSFRGNIRQTHPFRGPRMGGWIRRGRIWRFWGAPIFSPEVPKYQFLKCFGTSGRKIGAPQKRQIQPRIQPPHLQLSDPFGKPPFWQPPKFATLPCHWLLGATGHSPGHF